jgi:DNA-binding NarL/FixJ family response regulator
MALTRVLIVEDHPIFSKGLASLIITQPLYMVVGEAMNLAGAMELARTKQANLAIVDLNLGNENGIDVIKELLKEFPDMKILVVSMHDERYYAEQVLKAGAHGYIMKEEAGYRVLDAIKKVMAGDIYLSATEKERLNITKASGTESNTEFHNLLRTLTDRQLQVFSLIGKGMGTAEIAAKLSLSGKTVDAHKEHIKTKLRCDSSRLLQFAIEWNNR